MITQSQTVDIIGLGRALAHSAQQQYDTVVPITEPTVKRADENLLFRPIRDKETARHIEHDGFSESAFLDHDGFSESAFLDEVLSELTEQHDRDLLEPIDRDCIDGMKAEEAHPPIEFLWRVTGSHADPVFATQIDETIGHHISGDEDYLILSRFDYGTQFIETTIYREPKAGWASILSIWSQLN